MNRGTRAVLLVLGFGMLAILVVAGTAFMWWADNGAQFEADAVAAEKEGKAFGRQTDQNGCVNEAFERHRKPSSGQTYFGMMFLTSCLNDAKRSPRFCEGVPSTQNIFARSRWSEQRCRNVRIETPTCPALAAVIVDHCTIIRHSTASG